MVENTDNLHYTFVDKINDYINNWFVTFKQNLPETEDTNLYYLQTDTDSFYIMKNQEIVKKGYIYNSKKTKKVVCSTMKIMKNTTFNESVDFSLIRAFVTHADKNTLLKFFGNNDGCQTPQDFFLKSLTTDYIQQKIHDELDNTPNEDFKSSKKGKHNK